MEHITIYRSRLERRFGRVAWLWLYSYTVNNGERITYDTSLAGLKNYLKRKYPNASVHCAFGERNGTLSSLR